jgi:hypothetical protein
MHTEVQIESLNGRDFLGDLGIDERKMLKWFLKVYDYEQSSAAGSRE